MKPTIFNLTLAIPLVFILIFNPILRASSETFELVDLNGKRTTFRAPHLKKANQLLDQARLKDPEKEFKDLPNPNFNNDYTSMLTGSFLDENTKIELALKFDDPYNDPYINPTSCFSSSKTATTMALENRNFFRADQKGYGMIALEGSTYVRLVTTEENGVRLILGEVLRRKGKDWEVIEKFKAKEAPYNKTDDLKPLKNCYRLKHSQKVM